MKQIFDLYTMKVDNFGHRLNNRFESIDLLRSIAIIIVLFYHFYPEIFPGGWLGVDIFFVLSGFLIASILSKNVSISSFIYRRIFRVAIPLYFFILLFLPILLFILDGFDHLKSLVYPALTSLSLTQNFYFYFQEDYFSNGSQQPLIHLWTLGVEIQFYLIAAFSYFLFKKMKVNIGLIGILVLLLFLMLLPLLWQDKIAVFYLLPFRLYEFYLGVVAFRYKGKIKLSKVYLIWILIVLLLILGYIVTVQPLSHQFAILMVATMATFVAMININKGAPYIHQITSYISLRSYSLYLVHYPISFLALTLHIGWLKIILVFFAIIFSGIFYRFIDRAVCLQFRYPRFLWPLLILSLIAVSMLLTTKTKKNVLKNGPEIILDNVMIAGDSHLAHLDMILNAMNINVSNRIDSSCLPIPGISHVYKVTSFNQKNDRCIEKNKELIIGLDKVETVILSARWSYPTMGGISSEVNNVWTRETRLIDTDLDNKIPSLEESRLTFKNKMENFVELLKFKGINLVILGEVPPLGRSLALCSKTVFRGGDSCSDGGFNIPKVSKRLSFTRNFFQKLARTSSHVTYIDPFSDFCIGGSNSKCKSYFKNILLYSDDNHLNTNKKSQEYLVNHVMKNTVTKILEVLNLPNDK